MAQEIDRESLIQILLQQKFKQGWKAVHFFHTKKKRLLKGIYDPDKHIEVVPRKFDEVEQISSSLFRVKLEGEWGIYDTENKKVTWKKKSKK